MKQKLKAAVLLGALLGFGLGAPAYAATDAKKPHSAVKKSTSKDVAAAKPSSKTAAVPADKTAAKKAAKAPAKSASRAAPKKVASANGAKKSMRKVSMADMDPRHLMLYSASALVIDQETGLPLLEKQSDTVVPIASISKLMTAMVVLDAKLGESVGQIADAEQRLHPNAKFTTLGMGKLGRKQQQTGW